MRSRKFIRIAVLLVILLAVGWTFYRAFIQDKSVVQAGKPVPDFIAPKAMGEKVQLSTLKGKGVVLNFWGTWCPPCREEMPDLEKASKEFSDKGVVVLAVNDGEGEIAVRSFARQYNLTFPILLDSTEEITRKYQIGPLPTTFFIKPDGTLYKKVEGGPMSIDTIRDNMQKIAP
ncbi:thiol-disulfide oxidoreductase ResA [Aneurinibacillus tyrosinisolvens]|uniref:thiol-disulfide oxidoreductase ResA n=1 Tax=Aneurinibacillus tyrosinisolvens TaxID=1443435 RepID=UPI00063ED567|nr:thiol-disulfide oxidoreductase ResA [Aneurinibacillus tyrosinisolvens]